MRYRAQLDRVLTDSTCDEYLSLSGNLSELLQDRRVECRQSTGSYIELLRNAMAIKAQFDDFVAMLAKLTGAQGMHAPLKGPFRATEKLTLRYVLLVLVGVVVVVVVNVLLCWLFAHSVRFSVQ